jgi:hypothetical protein
MITGLAGAGLGYLGYRRSGQMKALELRIELKKAENSAREILDQLPALLDRAQASRTSVFVASGAFGSGNMVAWVKECDKDRVEVAALLKDLPVAGDDYRALSPDELESRLVSVDALKGKALHMRDKCRGTMAADENSRERLQATSVAFNPSMKGGMG